MRRSMSAKRYPPLLDWVELGAIAAAPLDDVCGVAVVVGVVVVGVVVVGAVVVACELVVLAAVVVSDVVVLVEVVGTVDVVAVVPVDVSVLADVGVVVEVVLAGGGGAPGVGGSVEAFGPVTSAPFLAVISTNADESGVWILASAPATLPWCPAVRYPTAPAGGSTRPIAAPNRSTR